MNGAEDLALDRLPSLEEAIARPLVGSYLDFHGFGQQPIGEIPTNALVVARDILEHQKSTLRIQECLAAVAVVLEHRRSQAAAAVAIDTTANTRIPTPAKRAPAASANPNSLVAMTRRITTLLERPDLSPDEHAAIRARLHNRDFVSIEQMRFELDRIEATLDPLPTPLDRAS